MIDVSLLVSFIVDALYSWARMFIALFLSIIIAIIFGVWAATSKKAERLILPVTDVLQTLPILAFFPIVLALFVTTLPQLTGISQSGGIDVAVIFLIVTSMVWNIIFGVYESIKTIPNEFTEIADLYRMNFTTRLRKIYVPAALPRIVQQSILSWAIGLFYLVTSEIFSFGNPACCHVGEGIGYAIVLYQNQPSAYLLALAVFIVFVIATRFLFFKPLEDYATKYMRTNVQTKKEQGNVVISWFHRRIPAQPITKPIVQPITKPITNAAYAGVKGLRKFMFTEERKLKPTTRTERKEAKALMCAGAVILVAAIAYYVIFVNKSILPLEYQALIALAFSFVRVWGAFVLITLIAVPLCIYLVFFTKHSFRYLTFFQIIASIPATMLLPGIVALLIGFPNHGEVAAFAIFFLSGIWYVIFSIIASTRNIPPSVFEVKNVYGVKGVQAWKKIYLIAIIPGLITGALTGIAAEWNASIVAEYFTSSGITALNTTTISSISSNSTLLNSTVALSGNPTVVTQVGTGMGRLLDSAASTGNTTLMLVALINLTVMILLINTFVWKRFYKQVSKIYG
jgi:NitT/TauT family transport system permease protein